MSKTKRRVPKVFYGIFLLILVFLSLEFGYKRRPAKPPVASQSQSAPPAAPNGPPPPVVAPPGPPATPGNAPTIIIGSPSDATLGRDLTITLSGTNVETPPSWGIVATTLRERLASEIAKLDKGTLVYRFPKEMKTGSHHLVIAAIGPGTFRFEDLHEQKEAGLVIEDNQSTPITPKMKMRLIAPDFEVKSESSEEQFIADGPTVWRWDIAPKHAGKLHLRLSATIFLEDLQKDYKTVDQDIVVDVDYGNWLWTFWKDSWQWILGGGGVIGTFLVSLTKKLKKPTKKTVDEAEV